MTKETKVRVIFATIIIAIMILVLLSQAGTFSNYGTTDCTVGFRNGVPVYDSCLAKDLTVTCIPIKYIPQNGYQELPGKCNRALKQ